MTPFSSRQFLALAHMTLLESCTATQMWVVYLGLLDVGQATIKGILRDGVLVLVQKLFESLAIHFIVEGIRLTQDLLNLCIEPGVGFLCS